MYCLKMAVLPQQYLSGCTTNGYQSSRGKSPIRLLYFFLTLLALCLSHSLDNFSVPMPSKAYHVLLL